MLRLEDIEDRLTTLERSKTTRIIKIDKDTLSSFTFYSSGYSVDIEIDVIASTTPIVDIDLNGVKRQFNSPFIRFTSDVRSKNELVVGIKAEGLQSKKIRIEGIGVRL